MSLITKQNLAKLLFESGMIVFSVFLALFINEYRKDIQTEHYKNKALAKIKVELTQNLRTLEGYQAHHAQVLQKLESLGGDDLTGRLQEKNNVVELIMSETMSDGLIQEILDDTAWQAFRSSSAYAEVEFERVMRLSKVYTTQARGVEASLQTVIDILYARESLQPENSIVTLQLLTNAMRELLAQEIYLIALYQKTLSEIRF